MPGNQVHIRPPPGSPFAISMRLPLVTTSATAAARALFRFAATAALALLSLPLEVRAEPLTFPIVYTTSATPPQVKAATLTYDAEPGNAQPPTASVSAPSTLTTLSTGYAGAVPAGADGIVLGSDGAYYVLSSPSNIHRVQLSPTTKVTFSIVSLAASTPAPPAPAGSLRLEPGQTHAWALGRGSTGRVARVQTTSPIAPGLAGSLTGHDTVIHDVCYVSGQMYYSAPGGVSGTGAIGLIDPATFATTRLMTGIPAAAPSADPNARTSTLLCDPLSGNLLVLGHDRITQIDITAATPVIISDRSLAAVLPGIRIVAGTVDGRGRLVALSATGHIVLMDYALSGRVGTPTNVVKVLAFDPLAANLVPLSGPGALRTSEKLWDNGDFDQRNGQYSTLSTQTGDGRTADDFALDPGSVYRIDALRATLFSNSPRPKARIELYADCNGKPGELLGAWDATLTPTGAAFSAFPIYTVMAQTPNLWLDGGRTYWVVPVGLSDATFPAQWYWGTTRNQEIVGTPGAFMGAGVGFPEWTSVASLPCGCTDFAFRVDGTRCEIIRDNGAPSVPAMTPTGSSLGAPILLSSLFSSTRAADDFVINSNTDALICYLRATIYTNCAPVDGAFELQTVRCGIPQAPSGGTSAISAPFARSIDLGYDVVYQGETLRAYRVEASDFAWYLFGGSNYVVSVTVRGTGSLHQRAVWAFADPCDTPGCLFKFYQATVKGNSIGATNWKPISQSTISPGTPRDLSFLIAGSLLPRCASGGANGGGTPTNPCPADFNTSGSVDADDIFSFLDAWFTGCP